MKALLTGGGGFLGSYFVQAYGEDGLLTRLGRKQQDHIQQDIGQTIGDFEETFDQVIHCAGKAHSIPKSKELEQLFFDINQKGTLNLLNALNSCLPKQFVLISTVAVYGQETGELINETYPLKGRSPYAQSKILAEQAVLEWGKTKQVKTLILRLPLIAGCNPPGNLGKMITGIGSGKYLSIAGGRAKRSVVLAEDVVRFVKQHPEAEGIYNLTDGYHPSFRDIEQVIASQLNKGLPLSIPETFAKILGKLGGLIPGSPVDNQVINKMINDLTFDDGKARIELGWSPRKVIDYFSIS